MPVSTQSESPGLRGEVVYLFAFDVANEVRLERAAEFLNAPAAPVVRRDRPAPRDVPVPEALTLEVNEVRSHLNGTPIRLIARIYDVGVISIMIRVALACESLADLVPYQMPVLDDKRSLDDVVREHCRRIRDRLMEAIIRPGPEAEPEAYTAFCLTYIGGEQDSNLWLASRSREVASLLTRTPSARLSDAQVAEVLRLQRSYENTDLVVIDWDAALVVELDGSCEDVLHVLEVANLQLEEFRWMDRALDRYLEQAYCDLGQQRWWTFGAATSVLRSLRQLRIDLTRLADEITHTTKFVGDWHLARVYSLTRERFHLDQWRASVDQRLGELDRLYTMTRGDLYDRRMLWLEVIIVLFFAIDLLLILFVK